jgi:acyl-CoA synthetase (NDP forming)
MADDERIHVIAMYLEGINDGRKLLRLAREVSRRKPIVLWKGGESEAGARTIVSHTGSLAGEQRLWEGFFRQTGAVQARSMNEWADAVLALCHLPASTGNGAFLIGGGGGFSVASSDTCMREGIDVPALSSATLTRLRKIVPVAGSIAGNPLDLWRTFDDADLLKEILELGYADPSVSMFIVDRLIPRKAFHGTGGEQPLTDIIEFVKARQGLKPTVFTVDYEGGDPELAAKGTALRAELCAAGLPTYPSLSRAARALAQHRRYHARWLGSN